VTLIANREQPGTREIEPTPKLNVLWTPADKKSALHPRSQY
jgi:hypothetical protein